MIQYGVGSTNLRKLISKDDSGATSVNATKVSEKLMYDIYGTKQKICLDKIIGNHVLYAPYEVAQTSQRWGDYKLENVKM